MSIVGETPQVSWPNFLFSFRGRISRRTYVTRGLLAFSCAMLLFYGSFDLIFAASAADRPEVFAAIFCFAGSVVIVLWMNAALTVKRLHDRDRSGWLVFVLLVPVVGLWITLETFFLRGTQAANSYGTPDIRKPNSRPVAIIIGVAALIALWFAIPGLAKSLVVQSFYIPSAAEEPTLLVGDYIFVSKSAYGYSRYSFPVGLMPFKGRIFGAEPQRGDTVVFKFPGDNSTDYIKRLIGLPGDRIQMKDGVLYINDKAVPKVRVEDYVEDDLGSPHHVPKYRETLPNGASYYVLDRTPDGDLDNTQVFAVPEGHYFMMGDNRDNSADSRANVGYVPFENLVGKVEVIFYSLDGSAPIWQFWKDLASVRYARIGARIH